MKTQHLVLGWEKIIIKCNFKKMSVIKTKLFLLLQVHKNNKVEVVVAVADKSTQIDLFYY